MASPGKGASPTRIIVTGGAGFLGTNFVRGILSTDADLVVISRRLPRWPVEHAKIRYIEQDIRDIESYRKELIPGSVVVHLASSTYPGKSEKAIESDIQDNVLGAVRLAHACAEAGVAQFIFLSSGGAIYGNQTVSPIPETALTVPVSAYGVMKLTIEHYLRIVQRTRGLPVICLRVGNPFGPWHDGRRQGAINVFLHKALRDEPIEVWGDGNQVRDFIPVNDVMSALWMLAREPRAGYAIYNIGTGRGCSINDILERLRHILKREIPVQYTFARDVDVSANVLDIGKAERELGWRPVDDFESSLIALADWAQREPRA
jgi:UDP-glucose 4-epimerase